MRWLETKGTEGTEGGKAGFGMGQRVGSSELKASESKIGRSTA